MPEFPIKQIVLLLDNRYDENWGSQATTSELVRGLQATYPEATITGIRRTEIRNPKWAFSLGYRWAPRGPKSNWRDPLGKLGAHLLMRNWQSALENADLIVVNGEGTLHPQPQTAAWLSIIDRIIESRKCPVWVVNCSIDLGDGSMNALVDKILSKVDRLVVREPVSFRFAIDRCWNAELGADCAFLAQPTNSETVDLWLSEHGVDGPYAVLTGSANAGSWAIENVKLWIDALRQRDLAIVFAASTPTDHRLYERLDLDCPLFSSKDFAHHELIALINRASIHLGGRFHPTIFAAKAGTPFVCIDGNTQKTAGLVELLETPNLLYSPDDCNGIVNAICCSKIGEKDEIMIEHCKSLGVYAQSNFRDQP